MVLALLAGTVVATIFGIHSGISAQVAREAEQTAREEARRADEEAARAKEHADAERQARRAEQIVSHTMRLALAERELQENQHERADALLDQSPTDLRHWEWHFLRRQVHPERLRLMTPDAPLFGGIPLAASPTEPVLATLAVPAPPSDKVMVEFRTFADDSLRRSFTLTGGGPHLLRFGDDNRLWLRFSADGRRLLVGGLGEPAGEKAWSYFARVLNAGDGREVCALRGHTVSADAGSFSPDGRRVVTAVRWGQWLFDMKVPDPVIVWDAVTGQRHRALPGVRGPVAFTPDGRYVLAEGYKAKVEGSRLFAGDGLQLFDVESGAPGQTLADSTGSWADCAVSPDGRYAAAVTKSMTRLWDLKTGSVLSSFQEGGGHAVFSPDGKVLAVCDDKDDGRRVLTLWSVPGGAERRVVRGAWGRPAFSHDGRSLAAVGHGPSIKVWSLEALSAVRSVRIPASNEGYAMSGRGQIAFSPDGRRLADGGGDQFTLIGSPDGRPQYVLTLIDPATGALDPALARSLMPILCPAFSPDGRHLAAIVGSRMGKTPGFEVRAWDLATGRVRFAHPRSPDPTPYSLAYRPDGREFAVGHDQSVAFCDAETGAVLRTVAVPAHHVAWDAAGRRLAVADSLLKQVRILDATTGAALQTWVVPNPGDERMGLFNQYGHKLAWSPDGRWIAAASEYTTHNKPGAVTLWDAGTGAVVLTLRGHSGPVNAVAFSPDGQRLVTGSEDMTVKVWELATGQSVLTLRGHTGAVSGVAFSPDSHRLASKSAQELLLWDGTPLP